MDKKIQTRSEVNGLRFHRTIEGAKAATIKDKTIWKFSYDRSDGSRVRMIRQPDNSWKNESMMDEINELLVEGVD
jgi:hypothetical protein